MKHEPRPSGVLAHTLHGERYDNSIPSAVVGGGVPAQSYVPYEDPRAGRCPANDNTCNGFATKRTGLCAGHSKKDDS